MSDKKEKSVMWLLLGIVLVSAGFAATGFYFYNNSEDTAFHKLLGENKSVKADVKRLDELTASNISTVAKNNVKVEEMEKKFIDLEKRFNEQMDIFRDQCHETREKQMQLRNELSNKRPVVKFTGPIPVEVYQGTTPPKSPHTKPTPKPESVDPKLLKKVKKQLDGLSR